MMSGGENAAQMDTGGRQDDASLATLGVIATTDKDSGFTTVMSKSQKRHERSNTNENEGNTSNKGNKKNTATLLKEVAQGCVLNGGHDSILKSDYFGDELFIIFNDVPDDLRNIFEIEKELDKLNMKERISKSRISGNDVLLATKEEDLAERLLSEKVLFKGAKAELLSPLNKRPHDYQVVVKGIDYNLAKQYEYPLASRFGIYDIISLDKRGDRPSTLIKAKCASAKIKNYLLKNGILIAHRRLKVEEVRATTNAVLSMPAFWSCS